MKSTFFEIIEIEETLSTNLHASDLLAVRNDRTPYIVKAGFQRKGKGQGKNHWFSDRDKNLLCSIVYFPRQLRIAYNFYISKITALSIFDALQTELPSLKIKWPNDIVTGEYKIAGILIENSLKGEFIDHFISGIGINVNQDKFPDFEFSASSLKLITGREYDTEVLMQNLIEGFRFWINALQNRKYDLIDQAYLRNLYRLNEFSSFRSADSIFKGRIIGVERNGLLLLETEEGELQKFDFKEIVFV